MPAGKDSGSTHTNSPDAAGAAYAMVPTLTMEPDCSMSMAMVESQIKLWKACQVMTTEEPLYHVATLGESSRRPYVGPCRTRTVEASHTVGNCSLHTTTLYQAPGVSQEVLA